MLVPLSTSGSTVSLENFWSAVFLYYERPHLVNRKLGGATTYHFYQIFYKNTTVELFEAITYNAVAYEANKLATLNETSLDKFIHDLTNHYDRDARLTHALLQDAKNSCDGVFIGVKVLHTSHPTNKDCVEVVVLDKDRNMALFVAASDKNKFKLVAPPFPYCFEYNGHVKLVTDIEDAESVSAVWLADKLFPKFIKWAEEFSDDKIHTQSLALIPIEKYFCLYKELKAKYGRKMVDIWPESTDSLKYVYEDIAIATYLMCLWEETSDKKPSFLDLGCGNGLLVYILTEEGYTGLGIDLRPRKIWDLYPKTVKLLVQTVNPTVDSSFPEADWIIGNHTDELTPWIPVYAAQSPHKTNFFVLPCCCYDFDGRKYKRKNSGQSQYSEYLKYIEEISQTCGFDLKLDKLRIPSTKRACIIGYKRDFDNVVLENITKMLEEKCASDFEPREKVERVRNCTQLGQDFITKILHIVLNELLDQSLSTIKKFDGSQWNSGSIIGLRELSQKIDKDDLKRMKSEHGGLQTLLRNHPYIFEVCKGNVTLSQPCEIKKGNRYKDKPCWFIKNHPDGCLYDDDHCAYNHFY